ncbi:MAG TPA: dihydroorotate dehydrogenase [Clostridiales bacterium]|nr:dihydroorotate dehydrogenase [Clostridiales bacterium]HQH62799.1 dihydroorotate dehydrogenase [Clostridiales bacterium]HQK73519.1 dihydroorotate dehydrogenase [Clostridiales bacterium]
MSSLQVNIAGVKLNNPLILASGTAGFGEEISRFYPLENVGAIACKGTTLEPRDGNPPPRIAETPSGIINSVGLENPGADRFINDYLPWLNMQKAVVIANIAGSTQEDYCALAEKFNDTAVDMVEMNISCPNVKSGGLAFGTSCQSVAQITRTVRSHCSKPLIVKLSPNVADIAEIAIAAESEGADALTLINTITAMKIDIQTRRPILRNNIGGLSGPAIFPIAVRMVWQTAAKVKIPVIGAGGISSWQDAVEIMLAGAAAFQIGTANFTDIYTPREVLKGLDEYLEANRLKSVNEIVGGVRAW